MANLGAVEVETDKNLLVGFWDIDDGTLMELKATHVSNSVIQTTKNSCFSIY